MPGRPRHPDPSRRDRHLLLDLAERLVAASELHAAAINAARLEARDPEPDVMLVRHLALEHLGRWIYLPGRPQKLGPAVAAEPSLAAAGGRLVGIRPGKPGVRDAPPYRLLVVLQGSTSVELPVPVDQRVDVAPREW